MKIRIIGPTGSGKTHLGLFLSRISNLPVFHTDHIVYEQKFVAKKPKEQQSKALEIILNTQQEWIIEGTTIGHTRRPSIVHADVIIYCDRPWYILRYRLLSRYLQGGQPGQKLKDLGRLLKYACDYQQTQHGVRQAIESYAYKIVYRPYRIDKD